VTYTVSDKGGNAALPVSRVVKVLSSGSTTNVLKDITALLDLVYIQEDRFMQNLLTVHHCYV
jgi:hypothetical protein